MTYRDRREARAERLRGWAEKREQRAPGLREHAEQMRGVIPPGQPILVGHHSEGRHRRHLDRSDRAEHRAIDNDQTAARLRSKADTIEKAADAAIYEDDPDALARLREKLAGLENDRQARKDRNATFRREHRAALRELSPFERDQALPHPGYELRNLGGNITRTRQRIARHEAQETER